MPQPAEARRIIGFGVFEIDLASGELRKHGLRVRLQDQPYQVLLALLDRPGEVVSRDELVRRLWPDGTYVDFDRGLNAAVTRLRQALSDAAEKPVYIETVARRGYRFIGELHGPAADRGRAALVNPSRRRSWLLLAAGLSVMAGAWILLPRSPESPAGYTQITDFTDSAIAPALSPDGRTVVFLRSGAWFLSRDQLWLKQLPDGEPVQLTRDPRRKFGPSFSLDGSRVYYTAVEPERTAWDTFSIPVLGGEPRLFMANAEGLTWIGPRHVLFSEIRKGIHMAAVTSSDNRSESRDVYVPEHERGMAHFSYLSPDRKWVLIVEMDHTPAWPPCRVVPFDGSSRGRQVGPPVSCTAAGWSPDGKWMYFTGGPPDGQHLWRQRFPQGALEQVTSGPAEAQGVAVAPDGRSVITSLGLEQRAIWMHDSRAERAVSSVGNASRPKYSPDGSLLFYLVNRGGGDSDNELWTFDPRAERSERLITGFAITRYDISGDGTEVVFAALPSQGGSQLWLAPLDRRSSPVRIGSGGEDSPFFGPNGQIVFRSSDGKANHLYRMNRDGSGREKVAPYPVLNTMGISPDGRWIATLVGVNDEQAKFAELAIPTQGGLAKRICSGFCAAWWSWNGRYFYVTLEHGDPGKTVVFPIPAGKSLPDLPPTGIRSLTEGLKLSGLPPIEHAGVAPGLDLSAYAYVKVTMQRNLFRIPVR